MSDIRTQLADYARLMRLDRPIGSYLLLWPTLWGLWIAAEGFPQQKLLVIFVLGVVVMRAAGCVINDFADRKIDGHVERTKDRPLASGRVTETEAIILFAVLMLTALYLVILTNTLTIGLAVVAALLAACYPFMKRYTYLPQVVLGAAFSMSIPMAFAAQTGDVPAIAWLLYVANLVWTVMYDTIYAIVDREDDLRIGVKSSAILFGDNDKLAVLLLQLLTLAALGMVGFKAEMLHWYYGSLVCAGLFFLYQQVLIKDRSNEPTFRAFLNNHWVGMVVFIGILLDYGYRV